MNLDQRGTLTVRSSAKWYELERDGAKPNTVRVVDEDELAMCKQAILIRVQRVGSPELFIRGITGVFDLTEEFRDKGVVIDCDQHVVIITWEA